MRKAVYAEKERQNKGTFIKQCLKDAVIQRG